MPEIESLRGLAIALVVLFHAGVIAGWSSASPAEASLAGAFISGGHTGVTLFFVLSGFLLVPPFLAEARGGPVVARASYGARRARRILPLYYLFVAVASVSNAGAINQVFRGVPYLLFLNSIPDVAPRLWPWSGVWWSLATEAQFYLLLPLLGFLGRRGQGRRGLAVLLVLYVVAYMAAVTGWIDHWAVHTRVLLFASVFGRGPAFACGALAAILAPALSAAHANARSGWLRIAPDFVLILLILALGLLLQHVVAVGHVIAELRQNWWHLVEAVLWSAVVLLVVASPWRAKPLLCNRVVGALGRWSYSLYLIHFPALWVGGAYQHRVGLAALIIAGCVGASAFSYRFVERPFFPVSASRSRNGS